MIGEGSNHRDGEGFVDLLAQAIEVNLERIRFRLVVVPKRLLERRAADDIGRVAHQDLKNGPARRRESESETGAGADLRSIAEVLSRVSARPAGVDESPSFAKVAARRLCGLAEAEAA